MASAAVLALEACWCCWGRALQAWAAAPVCAAVTELLLLLLLLVVLVLLTVR